MAKSPCCAPSRWPMSEAVVNQLSTGIRQQACIPPVFPQDRKGDVLRIGVIGYGYWGPNIVRNLHGQKSSQAAVVCDKSAAALARVRKAYPGIQTVSDPLEVLRSPEIDAVAVITPVWTHYELAKLALENGKHVFIEKPFTSNSAQAEELIELAARKNLTIMVDHTFLFTGAVRKIQELIKKGVLGDLYYYDSVRVNLGLFQHDVNVIWDLAPHDLSIMDFLIAQQAEAIVATGERHLNGHEDIAFITIYFPQSIIAHINVNWLSPDGVRQLLVNYRSGDMWSPQLEQIEALRSELGYFADCIENGKTPINDGPAGLRVVRMLEAAEKS